MNVMYIAARYHTNQIPIMDGWIKDGDHVMFVSQYQGGTEDYSILEPIVLGYSFAFHPILAFYHFIQKLNRNEMNGNYFFQASYGLPPIVKLGRIIKSFQPDVIIMRDRSSYNMGAYLLCTLFGVHALLYNQSPYYLEEADKKRGLARSIYRNFLPKTRITPVLGKEISDKFKDDDAYYVPFVIEPHISPEEKVYFSEGAIHLLCVGKFEPRKHHDMLIRIAAELKANYNIRLTLVGECKTEAHKKYFEHLKQLINQYQINDILDIKCNIAQDEVFKEYEKADLFILPSTGEFASVSQLEAMSFSLPVICSDTNGTSCYIEQGMNGYLFEDKNENDLKQKIFTVVSQTGLIQKMGAESYRLVKEKYQFKNYKKAITKIIEDMKR